MLYVILNCPGIFEVINKLTEWPLSKKTLHSIYHAEPSPTKVCYFTCHLRCYLIPYVIPYVVVKMHTVKIVKWTRAWKSDAVSCSLLHLSWFLHIICCRAARREAKFVEIDMRKNKLEHGDNPQIWWEKDQRNTTRRKPGLNICMAESRHTWSVALVIMWDCKLRASTGYGTWCWWAHVNTPRFVTSVTGATVLSPCVTRTVWSRLVKGCQ